MSRRDTRGKDDEIMEYLKQLDKGQKEQATTMENIRSELNALKEEMLGELHEICEQLGISDNRSFQRSARKTHHKQGISPNSAGEDGSHSRSGTNGFRHIEAPTVAFVSETQRDVVKPCANRKKQKINIGIETAPLPGHSLIRGQPNQRDFEKLMKSVGLDVSPLTLSSVSPAANDQGEDKSVGPALDTVLLVDISGSMSGQPLQDMKTFVNGVLAGIDTTRRDLQLEERVAVIMCGATTAILQRFTNHTDTVSSIMDQVQGEGKTPLMTALTLALCYVELKGKCLKLGEQLTLPPRVIVISDFHPTNNEGPFEGTDNQVSSQERIALQQQLMNVATFYRRQGYGLFCVPVGDSNQVLANSLATQSKQGDVIQPDDYEHTGNYLRYQYVVAQAMTTFEEKTAQNEAVEIEDLLSEFLTATGLTSEHREATGHLLDRALTAEDNYDPSMVDAIETDATSIESDESNPTGRRKYKPKWKPTKGVGSFNFVEYGGMPAIGSRIKAGRNWEYPNQTKHQPGTVIGHVKPGIVVCVFDNQYLGTYRYGEEDRFDIEEINDFKKPSEKGGIDIGCSVRKGPDWAQGEPGGDGIGVVIRKNPGKIVVVRWPDGIIAQHKFGADKLFQVKVVEEAANIQRLERASTAQNGGSRSPSHAYPPGSIALPPRPAGTAPPNRGQANVPSNEEQAWWKMLVSEQWRPLPEQTVNEIEAKFWANQERALVKYRGKSMKVFLKDMKCELDGTTYDIMRELMNSDDLKSMVEMEKFLPSI